MVTRKARDTCPDELYNLFFTSFQHGVIFQEPSNRLGTLLYRTAKWRDSTQRQSVAKREERKKRGITYMCSVPAQFGHEIMPCFNACMRSREIEIFCPQTGHVLKYSSRFPHSMHEYHVSISGSATLYALKHLEHMNSCVPCRRWVACATVPGTGGSGALISVPGGSW